MDSMTIFFILFVSVNAMVTSLFVCRNKGNFKRFFLSWGGIIILIEIITFVGAMLLPMQEEGLPFLFAVVAPIAAGTYFLNKMTNKMNPINGMKKNRIWQSLGIVSLAQVLSWLASFCFLPKYH